MEQKNVLASQAMGKGQRFDPNVIRRIRVSMGLSPEQFADLVKSKTGIMTGQTIRRWESGETLPQIPQLHALVDALNIKLDHLFPVPGETRILKRRGRPPKDPAKRKS